MNAEAIFVFGSNLAGRHGKGAALWAVQHRGAINGIGVGRQGYAYAIPTKDATLHPLNLVLIQAYVWDFLAYAIRHNALNFQLTPIGCGLAGYAYTEIGPMFEGAPKNIVIPPEFSPFVLRRTSSL